MSKWFLFLEWIFLLICEMICRNQKHIIARYVNGSWCRERRDEQWCRRMNAMSRCIILIIKRISRYGSAKSVIISCIRPWRNTSTGWTTWSERMGRNGVGCPMVSIRKKYLNKAVSFRFLFFSFHFLAADYQKDWSGFVPWFIFGFTLKFNIYFIQSSSVFE